MGDLTTPAPPLAYREALTAFCNALLTDDPALESYAINYRGGHLQALHTLYPASHTCLGDELFGGLGQAYLDHHPPAHWDLNLYGAGLPELIGAQTLGVRSQTRPWASIAALAHIEYAIAQAYYAPDSGTGTAAITLPASPVDLPPDQSIQMIALLCTSHPYARIESTLALGQPVQVWRDPLQIRVEELSPAQRKA